MKRNIATIALLAVYVMLYASASDDKNAAAVDSLRQLIQQSEGAAKTEAFDNLVSCYYAAGDADAALATLDEQIAFEEKAGRTEDEANARWRKIAILNNFSRTDELLDEADVQMDWFRRHEVWERYYPTWQRKANIICGQGKVQMALQEVQKMLNDAQERDNNTGRAMAYKQMGVIYLDMKQAELAIGALQRSASLLIEENNETGTLSNVYYRLCKAYDLTGDFEHELQTSADWLAFVDKLARLKGEETVYGPYNSCYLARASAYLGLGQFDEARQALREAGRYTRLSNSTLSRHHYYTQQARYYLMRGDAATALLYTDSVRQLQKGDNDIPNEIRAQSLMQLGRGEEAALLYQQLFHSRDSTFGKEARQHLDELNTLLQVDEIKNAEQRTRMRYTMIAVLAIVLALLLLSIFAWRFALRQKKAAKALRIANDRAEVSSKMKTEFIRNISHEIRTPLNIVSGFTQIMASQAKELPDNEIADIQQQISENTDRITKLVDRMLELSDASSETIIDRTDQTEVLQLMVKSIDRSRIALRTSPGKADSEVVFESRCDEQLAATGIRTSLRYAVRTLSQLLENAWKFTKKGKITLSVEQTDEMFRFTVEDTGIGIPADQSEHIFDEFVQLDSFADGTGIGLTVARSMARRLGGDLWLDTACKQGTRFVLELPKD